MNATNAQQIYDVIKNNSAMPIAQQPTEKALRYYADLVIQTGTRFDVSRMAKDSWTGRRAYQIARAIESLKALKELQDSTIPGAFAIKSFDQVLCRGTRAR